jgi:UDP-N-acetylmuramyl pentapeptide phosphotransferase/UDP-N-acetylglucosamine-1-phosphate transferase
MNDDWKEIYKLQYERIAQHENQRLAFSSLVVAMTTGALAWVAAEKALPDAFQILVLVVLLVLINYMAILFVDKSRFWIKHHQHRAKNLLALGPQAVIDAIASVDKIESNEDKKRRPNLQRNLHKVLIACIVVYALPYIWRMLVGFLR